MGAHAAITVLGDRAAVEQAWQGSEHRLEDAEVVFKDAPGDRGTELHVELGEGMMDKLKPAGPRAKAMDALRHFKAQYETGEVPRSDGSPEGEQAERKLKQRPAQPVGADA